MSLFTRGGRYDDVKNVFRNTAAFSPANALEKVTPEAGHDAHVEPPAATGKAIAEMCKQHDLI